MFKFRETYFYKTTLNEEHESRNQFFHFDKDKTHSKTPTLNNAFNMSRTYTSWNYAFSNEIILGLEHYLSHAIKRKYSLKRTMFNFDSLHFSSSQQYLINNTIINSFSKIREKR